MQDRTVLRDDKNKPIAPKLNTLQYLFEFLNAYDFASEGTEEIQEECKTLINASVLGLIFEKINGYKDGSIFTPGFIYDVYVPPKYKAGSNKQIQRKVQLESPHIRRLAKLHIRGPFG